MPILQRTKFKKNTQKMYRYLNITVSKTQIYKYYAITLKCTLHEEDGYYHEAHY
jgi:hypothetical protein